MDANTFEPIAYIPMGPVRRYALSSSGRLQLQNNVHGLIFSPDKKTMVVTSNISNSVVLYSSDNLAKVKNYINVGLSPHVSMFTPDSKELWVAVRGTSAIEVINVSKGKVVKKIETEPCPSFFAFDEAQTLVYVSYTCSELVQAYNFKTKKLIKKVKLNGLFSPLLSLSPDGQELWVIRKETGEVARIATKTMTVLEYIKVGGYPQHILFTQKQGRIIALVTVGADNSLKTYSFNSGTNKAAILESTTFIPGLPHGLAINKTKNQAYVATEHGDMVYAFDINSLKITDSAKIGNSPQSLVYISGLDLKDYKSYMRRFSDTESTNSFALNSLSSSERSVSMTVRSVPAEINFGIQIYGIIPADNEYRFYISRSTKAPEKLEASDGRLVGVVGCSIPSHICSSNSSLPHESSLSEMIADKKIKIYAIDKEGKLAFSNQMENKE